MNEIINNIENLLTKKSTVTIAIDGRCASGKTTLTNELEKKLSCNVIHLDHFFLQPFQRTSERLSAPGGNIDYERFICEVLRPLLKNEDFKYRPYLCHKQALGDEIFVPQNNITIVEGSYSCHPYFFDSFDLHIFLDIDKNTQLERLKKRNPKNFDDFINRWIPLEEKYFNCFDIKNKCEIVIP